jgi:S1-C subfamily serine protease
MRASFTTAAIVAAALAALGARAQDDVIIRQNPRARVALLDAGDRERAALGIGTRGGSKRDTLGLLVTSVSPGGPAEKAGIEEGNRIAAMNGVNLKLSPADAGEPDMSDALSRRLMRELRKVKAGDQVELKVYADGKYRTVKVTTKSLGDLAGDGDGAQRRWRFDEDSHGVIGLEIGGGGSKRDTLGLLITGVESDGPAAKAGIDEGDRVQSVNNVDVRVSRDDAGDESIRRAKGKRLYRALHDLAPGDSVQLSIWSAGQVKRVRLTAVKASKLYGDGWGQHGMMFRFDDHAFAPLPPLPPEPPDPPLPPDGSGDRIMRLDLHGLEHLSDQMRHLDVEKMLRSLEEQGLIDLDEHSMNEPMRHMDLSRSMPAVRAISLARIGRRDREEIDGLRLTTVSEGLASYFGTGTANGLLVVAADDRWPQLRPGDVIVRVNGHRVTNDDRSVLAQRDGTARVEFVRKGVKKSAKI